MEHRSTLERNMMRKFPWQHHLDDQQAFVVLFPPHCTPHILFTACWRSSLHVCKQSPLSSLAQVHCLLTGDMLILALVHCSLIPIGEEDWLRENADGVRVLQHGLQLEAEVRIKVHKVSLCIACRAMSCMWSYHVLDSKGLLSHPTSCTVKLVSVRVHMLWHCGIGVMICLCVLHV